MAPTLLGHSGATCCLKHREAVVSYAWDPEMRTRSPRQWQSWPLRRGFLVWVRKLHGGVLALGADGPQAVLYTGYRMCLRLPPCSSQLSQQLTAGGFCW